MPHTFYEFFAGGGMASKGLGAGWTCLAANDIDAAKGESYCANNDPRPFVSGDVAALAAADLPGTADLAWASFPCQDLSLAGARAGLKGARSGVFWAFWRLMEDLIAEGRAPRLIALENVAGAVAARGGADLAAIADVLAGAGYRVGCLLVDAAHFVPQSRPRLFVLAVHETLPLPQELIGPAVAPDWTSPALRRAMDGFSPATGRRTVAWALPSAPRRNTALIDILEDPRELAEGGVAWHAPDYTNRLLGLMDETNRAKISARQADGGRHAGALYRRTRPDGRGGRAQRAEVRFDGLAGCLRTPAGGSSRQTLVIVEDGAVRTRLLSPREGARLMGLGDDYRLPARHGAAFHLIGDGVAPPVVRFLAENLFERLLAAAQRPATAA